MAKENVREFKGEIQKICECTICYEEYNDAEHIPRILPCQHTFCTKCLSKQIRRQKLKCPLCNQEHYLTNGKVTTLAKDYTISNLKELLDKFSSPLCKECNNHTHAQYFCRTCDSRMCHICYCQRKAGRCRAHTFENQEVTSTTDTPTNSVCFLTGHEKNELKFFCCERSCSIAVCANCVVESHKNHKTMSITEEFTKRKKALQSVLQVTREKITNVKLSLDTICKHHALVTENYEKGRNSLNMQVERGQKYLTDFQTETEKYADEKFQKCIEMLEKRRAQIKFFIDNSTECCAITEEALSGKNMIAFLSVENTLTEKLRIFEQSDVQGPSDTMPAAFDFELQTPTLELKGKIDRMISKGDGSTGKFKFITEFWKFLKRKLHTEPEPSSFWDTFVSLFLVITLYMIVFLKLYPLPYSRLFSVDNTFLAIRGGRSSLLCYSTDTKRISNMPMENMIQTCGSNQKPYIFRGAFIKKSFDYGSEELVLFHIDVSGIKKYSPGLILFEFGVSKGSIERRNLLGSLSNDFFGWMLTVLTSGREVALINTEGRIVFSDTISVFDKASYAYYIEFTSDRTIVLKTRDKNGKSFQTLDETKSISGKSKMGFAKMCRRSDAYVTIKLSRRNMTFNRFTLYPNVYIAGDNSTISNNPQSNFSRKQIQKKDHTFQDIILLNCKTKCVYVLKIRVEAAADDGAFTLVLTNSQFLPSAHYNITLLTYTRCTVTNFVKYESYCLMFHKGNSRYALIPAAPNEWHSVTIMVNRQQKSASVMVGNHEMQLENGYIFEQHTPILRFVMQSTEDSVEIYLAHSDDFDILTWVIYKIVPYVDFLFSFIPIRRQYLCVLIVVIAIAYYWYNREGETEVSERFCPNRYVPMQYVERNFPYFTIPGQLRTLRRRRRH